MKVKNCAYISTGVIVVLILYMYIMVKQVPTVVSSIKLPVSSEMGLLKSSIGQTPIKSDLQKEETLLEGDRKKNPTRPVGVKSGLPKWKIQGCPRHTKAAWRSQVKEDRAVMSHYYNYSACNGTFLEIGALDGLLISNTFAYEKDFGWNGLLIEANVNNYNGLVKNRKNVKTVHSAACSPPQTSLYFSGGREMGKVIPKEKANKDSQKVPCKPFGSLIRDAGLEAIDVLFLDVEGGESFVLESMDWDIPVGVWVIEVEYPYSKNQAEMDKVMRKTMLSHGYIRSTLNTTVFYRQDGGSANVHPKDEVFEHPHYRSYLEEIFKRGVK